MRWLSVGIGVSIQLMQYAQSVDSTCACVTAGIACISSADGACVRARLFMLRGICRCMCVYAASEAAK